MCTLKLWCSFLKVSLPFFTLGCTLASVSSPPAEPQRLQCHHNVEQILVCQVVSGIWLKKRHTQIKTKTNGVFPNVTDFCPKYLHIGSRHAAKLLLEDGQHVPHRGGESLRIQHAEGAATLRIETPR